jgi:chromosome segregation ATPase
VEKNLGSLGQRVTDIQTSLDAQIRRRDEFVQDTARLENDGRALAATIATQVERFALEKTQFEAFEQRMERLVEFERQLSYLPERLEEFSRTFEALTNQASELRMTQAELAQKSDELEQKLKALADRETVVSAVKGELDTVHQMSAKSKADLQYINEHSEDLSLLRSRLEELLTLTAAAEQKIRRNFSR